MHATTYKLRLGFAVAVIVASLGIAAGAQARVLPDPGEGTPVTQKQARTPAQKQAKRSTRRTQGGFPARSGVHVRNPSAPPEE